MASQGGPVSMATSCGIVHFQISMKSFDMSVSRLNLHLFQLDLSQVTNFQRFSIFFSSK